MACYDRYRNGIIPGRTGGKWYEQDGNGANYLCLPETPVYDTVEDNVQSYRGFVYSAEYSTSEFPPLSSVHDHDVPCAVCEVNRGKILMIPATNICPSGWIREYYGYLMSEYYNRGSPTEFVCVDRNPDVVPGTGDNRQGVHLCPVEGRCDYDRGSLPCGPYVNGAELSCVVCSK
ncbi:short-chain collagen C4-like [Amphiura filiformis]|uniref:short-chain collagen C4-like n=1 Tax=Amphiura filiformis TaxID=82378 RepID=UPI003B20B8AA